MPGTRRDFASSAAAVVLVTLTAVLSCSAQTRRGILNPTQLPAFDLEAAWSASVARGQVAPSTIPPRAFPSAYPAIEEIRVSIDRARVYLIEVPAASLSPVGNITVGHGQLLVIQGTGGLVDRDATSRPLSTWVLDPQAPNQPTIHVLPGGAAYIRNLTIINPTFGLEPHSLETFVSSNPLSIAREGALAWQDVLFILSDCAMLQVVQYTVCSRIVQDTDLSWPSVEMEPGWLHMYRLRTNYANVSAAYTMWTCDWPIPNLYSDFTDTHSLGNSPDAPPIQASPLYPYSLVPLNRAGMPTGPVTPMPGELNTSTAAPPLQCVARRVKNSAQLQRALIELQGMSTQYVIIQVIRNMTLQPDNTSDVAWPRENMAVRIYRNVTILGRHVSMLAKSEGMCSLMTLLMHSVYQFAAVQFWVIRQIISHFYVVYLVPAHDVQPETARFTEVDMNNLCNIFWLGPSSTLRFQLLTLTNLPVGYKEAFPSSMMIVLMWSVAWDRMQSDDAVHVDFWNCTLVLAKELFAYSTYWVGIQASPVPSIRQMASWQTTVMFQGKLEVMNNSKTYMQRRWGQGMQWVNTSTTDVPGVVPVQPHTCTFLELVPGEPYFPYTRITPVRNAYELAVWLANPPTPVLMLMNNITFNLDTVQMLPQPDVNDATKLSSLGLGSAIIAAQQQLSSTAAKVLQDGVVRVTQGVTVLGWCEGNTVLDFGNTAGLVRLDLPIDQQLIFKRLTLTGLGPALAGQQPADLANITSYVWAFDYERNRDALVLQNVTLVVPQHEIDLIRNFSIPTPSLASPITADKTAPPAAPVSTVPAQRLHLAWETNQVRNAPTGHLDVARARWQGIQAMDLTITSTLPPELIQELNITPTPEGLMMSRVIDGLSDTSTAPAIDTADSGLEKWKVLVLSLSLSIGLLVLGAGALCAWTRWAHSGRDNSQRGEQHKQESGHSLSSVRVAITDNQEGEGRRQSFSRAALSEKIQNLINNQREKRVVQRGDSGITAVAPEGLVLEKAIGSGGFATVYRGRWRGMTVAVKTIVFPGVGERAAMARQRAINEAAINTVLSHECLCSMYAYDLRQVQLIGNDIPDQHLCEQYRLYIIQEYCDAGTLAEAVDQGLFMCGSSRRMEVILQIAYQVAQALAYIHENNVIHGDLSSGNVMLRTAPDTPLGIQAKVCDFGLSRFLEEPDKSYISDVRQGTPNYVAPEIIQHAILSREADVYSFGVVLWELYNAQRPPWRYVIVGLYGTQPSEQRTPGAKERQEQAHEQPLPARHLLVKSDLSTESVTVTGGACVGSEMRTMPDAGNGVPLADAEAGVRTTGTDVISTGRSSRPQIDLSKARPFPLPLDGPPLLHELIRSCLSPKPKARPRMTTVTAVLAQLIMDAGITLPGLDPVIGYAHQPRHDDYHHQQQDTASAGPSRPRPPPGMMRGNWSSQQVMGQGALAGLIEMTPASGSVAGPFQNRRRSRRDSTV